jgi:geranylgeranyl reductase family protein
MKQSQVCIVGAGPAGSIAALFLAKFGINCTLVDKATFPRDKICGDGISGWVVTILNELDKDLLIRLSRQSFLLPSYGIRIVAPNFKSLDLPFMDNNQTDPTIPPGFIGKRIDFDNFLIEEVKAKKEIELLEATEITGYTKEKDGIRLQTSEGKEIYSRIVIFSNGANSKFMQDPGGIYKSKKHIMTGLKAYYTGITGLHEQNYVELHFLKDILPGYFWIFPLPNGLANVGIGLDQERIRKKKLNLKAIMLEVIETVPYLKDRFKNAELVSKIQAHSLPLWDGKRFISGDHYMLTGDAASLIDPVTGEGIGHAAISGMYAAEQCKRSLESNNFSAKFMRNYDKQVYGRIGKELKISSKIVHFIKHPWLFNLVVTKANSSKILKEKLTLAMTNLEVRKELNSPWLYLKILLGK